MVAECPDETEWLPLNGADACRWPTFGDHRAVPVPMPGDPARGQPGRLSPVLAIICDWRAIGVILRSMAPLIVTDLRGPGNQ